MVRVGKGIVLLDVEDVSSAIISAQIYYNGR
jgi:hypothetical protein